MKFRVGLGFDVHELKDGAPLYLGGVAIPSDKGAVGHSDADVLIHAICDAMLGAAGMRDIGFHFSNKDERWRNADSKIFLKEVTRMLSEAGWQTENLDCTLVLEAPKIGNYVSDMKRTLAGVIGIELRFTNCFNTNFVVCFIARSYDFDTSTRTPSQSKIIPSVLSIRLTASFLTSIPFPLLR